MNIGVTRSILIAALIIVSAAVGGYSQTVEERNVRAGMTFLAGDAMQGRGSGTTFERITAEYVGTQFMQFGLEAAGDNGFDGKPGYTQTVNISRASFADSPFLKYGSASLSHGGEMVVMRTNSGAAAGDLQKLAPGEKPNAGSAVFIRPTEGEDPRALQQRAQALAAAGAAIVIIEETPQYRTNWANMAGRRIGFTVTSTAARPSVMLVVSKTAAAALAEAPAGTKVEFGGTLAPVQTTQTWNVIGKMTGTDPTLNSDVIVLSSHLDHLGVRENAPGDDKIFNGADDDASGTVAVMELARVLAAGKRPKRTAYFVCFGSEEAGGFGSGHFVNTLPFPKERSWRISSGK